jgi:hypothetical protein
MTINELYYLFFFIPYQKSIIHYKLKGFLNHLPTLIQKEFLLKTKITKAH